MLLTISTIVSRFDLELVDPTYNLELSQALTTKPKNLRIRAIPRSDRTFISATPSLPAMRGTKLQESVAKPPPARSEEAKPLYVLYGSNTGTSEAFAQRIASDAASYGKRRKTFFV